MAPELHSNLYNFLKLELNFKSYSSQKFGQTWTALDKTSPHELQRTIEFPKQVAKYVKRTKYA